MTRDRVRRSVFKPGRNDSGNGLSFHLLEAVSREELAKSIDDYLQVFKAIRQRTHLPGCAAVSYPLNQDLSRSLRVQLQVTEEPYGNQHYVVMQESSDDLCPDKSHQQLLAEDATYNIRSGLGKPPEGST